MEQEGEVSRNIDFAYHEAGHAMIAYRLGIPVREVSMQPTESTAGWVGYQQPLAEIIRSGDTSDERRIRMERYAMVCLAGREAQMRFNFEELQEDDYKVDLDLVTQALNQFSHCEEEVLIYEKLLEVRTRRLLDQPMAWEIVTGLAKALLKNETMSSDEVNAVLEEVERGYIESRTGLNLEAEEE
jgi:ATP-dependent Zn protease